MGSPEEEFSAELVVFLIERSTGYENAYGQIFVRHAYEFNEMKTSGCDQTLDQA